MYVLPSYRGKHSRPTLLFQFSWLRRYGFQLPGPGRRWLQLLRPPVHPVIVPITVILRRPLPPCRDVAIACCLLLTRVLLLFQPFLGRPLASYNAAAVEKPATKDNQENSSRDAHGQPDCSACGESVVLHSCGRSVSRSGCRAGAEARRDLWHICCGSTCVPCTGLGCRRGWILAAGGALCLLRLT